MVIFHSYVSLPFTIMIHHNTMKYQSFEEKTIQNSSGFEGKLDTVLVTWGWSLDRLYEGRPIQKFWVSPAWECWTSRRRGLRMVKLWKYMKNHQYIGMFTFFFGDVTDFTVKNEVNMMIWAWSGFDIRHRGSTSEVVQNLGHGSVMTARLLQYNVSAKDGELW